MNDDRNDAPRGIRNNNPLNIREAPDGGDRWQGERKTDDDTSFEEFETVEYGIRAAVIILRKYQRDYECDTLRKIINKWAPPVENNTSSYVDDVAKRMSGIDPDAPIDLQKPQTLCSLISAMIWHENGEQPYSPSVIMDGIRRA